MRDIGSAFTEGLTAPFTAIKELGVGFMSMLKPLKLIPKLLKGFVVGLIGTLAAMLPFLLIIGAVALVLFALKKGFDFVVDNLDVIKEKLGLFADAVMAIPGKIADFFTSIFTKIKNFFIDAINGVIELLNKIPGVEIKKIEKAVDPATIDTETPGQADSAFTAGNLDQRTNDIEANESGLIPTAVDERPSFLDKLKGMFATSSGNNEYLPVSATAPAGGSAIIDNSIKTVNQNNTTQSIGISSRNDDVTIKLSDAAA